ncbi:alpha/beta fold hydrolase [Cryptosporangium sp. NPDC051539]|uniref:S9 family peptidase n=1 Tax=Cryptosporangium sp. NPDC051539 TaxID=3363962 RepID=UPI0037BD7BB0
MPTLLERYQQAAALAPEKLPTLLRNRRVDPVWTGDGDAFWYRRQAADGEQFVLVDPVSEVRTVGASLAELGVGPAPPEARPGVLWAPDRRGLRRRNHDLWLVDGETETPVTSDGEPGFAWGALPSDSNMFVPFTRAGLDLPPLGTVHSPSGRRVLTMRTDERSMRVRHMTENVPRSGAARPECHEWRVHLEDEGEPAPAECRVLDLDTGDRAEIDVADGLASLLRMNGSTEVTWSADESRLYLFHCRQGSARAALVEVDVKSGERRDVLVVDERPLYEANQFLYSLPLVRVLPATGEAILFSQRDGWGHLYLYDLVTGACKNRISDGELVVRDLLHVDAERREITYLAGSADDGWNPYWRRVYRAGFDGGTQRLLTPEPMDHELVAPEPQFFRLVFGRGKPSTRSISPSGRFFVDHRSTVSDAPVIALRDADDGGRIVLELERTDIGRLLDAGYVVPRAFRVKADDGVTDLWGVYSLPAEPHDPQRIPVVEDVYGGFQTTQSPHAFVGGSAMASRQVNLPSYNALGFAAVMLDGRGTPGRDRAFRQWTFQQFHTGRGLEDHVTVITALARECPALDLERVGVVGHSYGGYNAARLLLMFPDFYRSAVSSAGVHDPRKMRYGSWDWHLGPEEYRGSEEYRGLGNVPLADRLRGDLLLACGEIDENATVDHTFALADALIQAGKRFDFKIWPGVDHYTIGPYARMTFWDHFVRSLLGQQPPREWAPIHEEIR